MIRKRPPYSQKSSRAYNDIDKQIFCLHRAIGDKLLNNHQYIEQVCNTIEERYRTGSMRHGAYLFWSSLMEHIHQPDIFLSTLLEESSTVRQYRRRTPLVGILTEEERQAALSDSNVSD